MLQKPYAGGYPAETLVPLPLLVARVLTDHSNDTATTHHFAFVADLLDARSHFHDDPPLSSLTDLLMPVRNPASARIVRRNFNCHAVTRKYLNVILPHPTADRSEDSEAVVRFDPKHSVGQSFLYNAIKLELIAFGLFR